MRHWNFTAVWRGLHRVCRHTSYLLPNNVNQVTWEVSLRASSARNWHTDMTAGQCKHTHGHCAWSSFAPNPNWCCRAPVRRRVDSDQLSVGRTPVVRWYVSAWYVWQCNALLSCPSLWAIKATMSVTTSSVKRNAVVGFLSSPYLFLVCPSLSVLPSHLPPLVDHSPVIMPLLASRHS